MNKKEKYTNNKLIAEFMGLKDKDKYLSPPLEDAESVGLGMHVHPDEMRYHQSWDWLMPVAEKCLTTNEPTDGQHYFINDALLTCNIDVVYDAVVKFINQITK